MQKNEVVFSKRLTKQLELFRQFLVSSWPNLDALMEHHNWDNDMGFSDDWIQANWEFLVERELLGNGIYLSPLSAVTTRKIQFGYSVCTLVKKDLINLRNGKSVPKNTRMRFFGFCTALEKGFGLYPPFDLANLVINSSKEFVIAPFSELEFYLEKEIYNEKSI